MDPQQLRLEQMLDLFIQDGWKMLMEDLKESTDALQEIDSLQTLEDLYSRKGQLLMARQLLTLEDQVRRQLDELSGINDAEDF